MEICKFSMCFVRRWSFSRWISSSWFNSSFSRWSISIASMRIFRRSRGGISQRRDFANSYWYSIWLDERLTDLVRDLHCSLINSTIKAEIITFQLQKKKTCWIITWEWRHSRESISCEDIWTASLVCKVLKEEIFH